MFYPLQFEPNLQPVIWGGHQLRPYKGLEPSDEPIGESWEVSAVPSSTSVVSNGIWKGKDLISLINEYPEEILGKAVNRKYHGQLPLLVKFIDAERDLSIQVHPNDDMAQRLHGKMGKPRELHTALASQALNFHVEPNYRTEYADAAKKAVQVIETPYFDVRVMEVSRPFHRELKKYESFIITMCIEGDCKIRVRSTGDEILLTQGNSTLIPAAIADYDIIPLNNKTRILDAFIDNMDRSLRHILTRFLHLTQQ